MKTYWMSGFVVDLLMLSVFPAFGETEQMSAQSLVEDTPALPVDEEAVRRWQLSSASRQMPLGGGRNLSTDLCLVIDGSGSMSAEQFSEILAGFAQAVEAPEVVPGDGSVRLGVQLCYGRERTDLGGLRIRGVQEPGSD